MKFSEIVAQASALLQRKGRITYRALQRELALDDEALEDLKNELIDAEQVARDENGKVLVWIGEESLESGVQENQKAKGKNQKAKIHNLHPLASSTQPPAAERRQLTVMFCDLVGSTALSTQLDPEDYHAVVQQYHQTCEAVIQRYGGFVPQHLGDGLLVYLGYPVAHEDDAQRAVRTALGIVEAIQALSFPTIQLPKPLQVRIGIHTGLVVIGEIGGSEKREMLALGETPNLAARVQGVAEPNTVAMSGVTQRLVRGLFECQELGTHELKGFAAPVVIYRVVGERAAQSRFEAAVSAGLTPLVGREEELSVLRQRWAQAKEGVGQVVLVSGEAGIGKSRLVQTLKEQVLAEGATRIEFHCSPYHQNSALYPIIDHLQRLLQWTREDTPTVKLEKLQLTLNRYRFPQAETFPLFAALLSLPHPEDHPPIAGSPQKQREKTQAALVAWLVEEAEQRPVYMVWEDLHWADPSTLEVLTLVLKQVPITRLCIVLTFRPEFVPPWGSRSYLTQLTLNRLGHGQVETMIARVATGTSLPAEVVEQIRLKTDGVPLFVEELTKSVVESAGAQHAAPLLQLGIPATLQDALMARLDRLGPVKEIAQLGATLGREFSYELLHSVSNQAEGNLQNGLRQLVEAELLYQRGLPPQATYLFKHALIQDTAYQSLLKSKRQQLHQHIAEVLEMQFAETKETQPELLAYNYTEAKLTEQAIPYWQKAGQRAAQRSAHVEAVRHLTKGLEVLKTLPDTQDRAQQELTLQVALGAALVAVKGYTASETEKTILRARALSQRLGETPQLFPVLFQLYVFYLMKRELQTAYNLAEQLLRLAQSVQDLYLLSLAHAALGCTLFWLGELTSARPHLEQAIALYDPRKHPRLTVGTADPRVDCLSYVSWTLWGLGYPEQALRRSQEAVALAEELAHPFSRAYALACAARLHQFRREIEIVREQTEVVITLSTEQGFPTWLSDGITVRGWVLIEQGQVEEGVVQMQQGLAAHQAMGAGQRPYMLALLAEAYGKLARVEEGLTLLVEALEMVKTGERPHEAELHRLKGELTLQKEFNVQGSKFQDPNTPPLIPSTQVEAEAEACFCKAVEIAQKQHAKSLELRATVSLARLWQSQGKQHVARNTLSTIYSWFTEGFDTVDLKEAKVLLEELSEPG